MTRARRLLIARVAIAVLLGTLALAGTASAESAATPAPEAVTSVSESPVSELGGEASPPVQLVVEPVPEPPPPPVEVVEPVKETPPVEAVVEPVKETPPVEAVSEPVHEDAPPVEAVKEPTPEVGPVVTPAPEPATPVILTTEQTKEALSTSGGGQAPEGLVSALASDLEGPPPGAASGSALSETAVTPSTPVSAAVSREQERSTGAAILAAVRLTAAQRAADLSCQLSGLSGPSAGECAAALAGEQRSPASTATLVAVPATTGTGAPPDGGYSGSTGASRSAAPPPGPAPSGAFGGSSAGGAGGALSGFFTLAGLLLLAGPRAMRRLRLSCRPWLTAFFVLIPERPG